MNCASASWIFTSRPNSVGLASLPFRMISVCGSKRLTTLPGKRVLPRRTRARVCATTRLSRSMVAGSCVADLRSRAGAPPAFGLAQDGAGDPHQLLVELFHACLALRAHLRADPGARLATALRDLEDPTANGTG